MSKDVIETIGILRVKILKSSETLFARKKVKFWLFVEVIEKKKIPSHSYVWEHLDIGYMQGMCDLVAPLLVIFDDESLSYGCFCRLMERMIENFPNGGAMDMHFANMRLMSK